MAIPPIYSQKFQISANQEKDFLKTENISVILEEFIKNRLELEKWSENDLLIAEFLWKHQKLPISFFFEIIELDCSLGKQWIADFKLSNKHLEVLKYLRLSIQEFNKIGLINQLNLIDDICEQLSSISKLDTYFIEATKNSLREGVHSRVEAVHHWMKKQHSKNSDSFTQLPISFYEDVMDLCVYEQKYDLLLNAIAQNVIFTQARWIDKPLFHFLLDKVWMQDSENFAGGQVYQHAFILAQALMNELNNSSEESVKNPELKDLYLSLIESLTLCARWNLTKDTSKSAQEIVDSIQTSSIPILVGCGVKTHAISMSVEKTTNQTIKLSLYNTGNGLLTYHPRLSKDSLYFQTCVSYEDIPLEKILDVEFWENILNLQYEDVEIDRVYELFEEMGKTGHFSSKSTDEKDFEPPQLQGTCSAQTLMAFLRKQIRDKISGTTFHKMGVYKLLKARVFIQIGRERLSQSDQRIQEVLKGKMEKHTADLALAKIVENESLFKDYCHKIFSTLENCGEMELVLKLKAQTFVTAAEKYYLLQSSLKVIAKVVSHHPEKLEFINFEENALVLAQLTLYEKFNNQMLIEETLHRLAKSGDWRSFKVSFARAAAWFVERERLMRWFSHELLPTLDETAQQEAKQAIL